MAFSGTVKGCGKDYTEAGMNTAAGKSIPETATAETFKQNEYRLLIVANKFQTGFDQPLLHTMYVDKKLGGVNAVQTLSRLNRICPPDKEDTMVLDCDGSFVEWAHDAKLLEVRHGIHIGWLAGPIRNLRRLFRRPESLPQLRELRSSGGLSVSRSAGRSGGGKAHGELLRVF